MTAMSSLAAYGKLPTIKMLAAWLVLLLFESMAQIGLKSGGDALAEQPFGWDWVLHAVSSPGTVCGIVGYIGSFCAWMAILDKTPLSFGFPLTAVVMLVVTTASCMIFGEVITPWRGLGIGLVLVGVFVMGGDET